MYLPPPASYQVLKVIDHRDHWEQFAIDLWQGKLVNFETSPLVQRAAAFLKGEKWVTPGGFKRAALVQIRSYPIFFPKHTSQFFDSFLTHGFLVNTISWKNGSLECTVWGTFFRRKSICDLVLPTAWFGWWKEMQMVFLLWVWRCQIPSGKLTWLVGKWTRIEDVFPIKNGGFSIAMEMFTRG